MTEAAKWMDVLNRTKITLPTEKDRKQPLYTTANIAPPKGDTFPSAPNRFLDDEYTDEYVQQVRTELMPLVDQSEAYLESYGFTIIDFMREGVEYDPSVIINVASVLQGITRDTTTSLINSSQSIGWNEVEGCLRQVFEIDAITALLNAETGGSVDFFNRTTRRALIKIIGKTFVKCLDWVGAAMTVYEFTDCLMAENKSIILYKRWMLPDFQQVRLS